MKLADKLVWILVIYVVGKILFFNLYKRFIRWCEKDKVGQKKSKKAEPKQAEEKTFEAKSDYKTVRDMFNIAMKGGKLNHRQILFIESYLRKRLNDRRKYKNNAHAIYSMLPDPQLDATDYGYIEKVLKSFQNSI